METKNRIFEKRLWHIFLPTCLINKNQFSPSRLIGFVWIMLRYIGKIVIGRAEIFRDLNFLKAGSYQNVWIFRFFGKATFSFFCDRISFVWYPSATLALESEALVEVIA